MKICNSVFSLKARTRQNAPNRLSKAFPVTYLISSTFSATSMHIDERKRSHHESRCIEYKRNHDLLRCDKGEEQKNCVYKRSFLSQSATKRRKQKSPTRPIYKWTIQCVCVLLSDELCSSKRSTGRINRIHSVRARPPFHTAGICFSDFGVTAGMETSCSIHGRGLCVDMDVWRMRWGTKAGGCAAAWRAPSCWRSHSRSNALPMYVQPA